MSYPRTTEERLVKLYGFTLQDLEQIFKECDNDLGKYKQRIDEIDRTISAKVFTQITSDNFILH